MSLIGYARVSTAEGRQVLDRQLDALNEAGCERVFEDRASGAASDRPKLAACLDHLRQSDVLVVLDLDRLGRRAGELIALIDELDRRGVGFRALNSPMDTTTPAGRAFMQIQAAFAEMERNVMRQRIREGVKAARARGRKGGRPRVMTHEKLRYAQNLMVDRTRSNHVIGCYDRAARVQEGLRPLIVDRGLDALFCDTVRPPGSPPGALLKRCGSSLRR